ncbi:MAG: PcfJ domain-containing protein [Pseudodesulfovibrio sp.]|nr:PcfJ domain-containing protein [Pseudodesulfovibrio sp.]
MLFDSEYCHFDGLHNVLEIDLQEKVGLRYQLTSWDSGLEVLCNEGQGWEPSSALDEWTVSDTEYDTSHPISLFGSTIAPEALKICQGFDHYALGLLRLLRHVPESMDLLQSIPALTWLIPEQRVLHGMSWEELSAVCRMKRRDILKHFFGSGSKSLVKVFKLIKHNGTRFDYSLVREIATDPNIHKILRHSSHRDLHKVVFLAKAQGILHHTWFRNALFDMNFNLSHGYISDCVCLARDIIEMGKALQYGDAELTVARCPDFGRLYRLHESWVMRLNSKEMVDGGTLFDTPPIDGDATIVPIKSEQLLSMEGKLMSHCVASYLDRVKNRECYIYRVLKPERGTLEIRMAGENRSRLSIGQFKLYANRNPSQESWKRVHDWFDIMTKTSADSLALGRGQSGTVV